MKHLKENLALALTHIEVKELSLGKALKFYQCEGLADSLSIAHKKYKYNRDIYNNFLKLGFTDSYIHELFIDTM